MPQTLNVTNCLVALNVVVFLAANFFAPLRVWMQESLPLYFPLNGRFHVGQLVSTMFMHGGFGHLFMNMFGLFSFGTVLERVWGAKRFLIFYLVAGIGAGVIYSAVNYFEYRSTESALLDQGVSQALIDQLDRMEDPVRFAYAIRERYPKAFDAVGAEAIVEMIRNFTVPAVGASGAIYGILTAFGLLFPNAKLSLIFLPVPVAAKYFIPALLLLDLFSGITGFSLFGGGIAHFAHIGGAVIGFLLMLLWRNELSAPRGDAAED